MSKQLRIIISGGGTGGHIFPAVSIANEIKAKEPDAEILFVGAEGRMEMQRVPQAGYEIKGLPVRGLVRPLWSPRNIGVMLDFIRSRRRAKQIIREFRPQVAVGVGGYASSPTLNAAYAMGVPCLVQEQNSYAGVTNKSLAKKARRVCVAYEGMERFFPKERIILTGNPVRQNLLLSAMSEEEKQVRRAEAIRSFGLNPDKRTVLVIGGSLGARTMNQSILRHLDMLRKTESVQVIWQTGKFYSAGIAEALNKYEGCCPDNMHVTEFVSDMAAAYAAADLVVSRAGASSISELCLLGKASILVPSPNVAEDHQTKNARALSNRGAALFVSDAEAPDTLLELALKSVMNGALLRNLGSEAQKLAKPNAASDIADEVIRLAREAQV